MSYRDAAAAATRELILTNDTNEYRRVCVCVRLSLARSF